MYAAIKIIRYFVFLILPLLFSTTLHADPKQQGLSLQTYLNQVCHYNRGLQGSSLVACGACQRVGEGRLLMRPKFFAEGQYLTNTYNPVWSPLAGTSNQLQTYQAGISETTPYGVQGKLYYNYQKQSLHGISPLLDTPNSAITSSPMVELTVPLARNWAGRETRATAQLIDSQARLTHFSEQFKIKQLLAQAESAYWRLAIARAIVGIQQDSLHRAATIEQWIAHRVNLNLAEGADRLQASAAVQAKQLDVQAALSDACLAARAFNTLRGSCQGNVDEQLCSYHGAVNINLPKHVGPRDDVNAAKQEEQIAIANARLGIEKNKPSLDLYASYALNGNEPTSNAAVSESFSLAYPSTAVGLRLSVPLDVGCVAKIRSGYRNEIAGAKDQFAQKVYEDKRQWQDLNTKLCQAHQRLELALQLEAIQLKKLQVEKERLALGKTTTYQVLMFEQDYANAQLTSLVIQDQMYSLIAQLKTYGA